jgi:hypothetical protein
MTESKDILNFLKLLSAENYLSLLMTASQEKYGKSFLSLEAEQKKELDAEVWTAVRALRHHMSPQWLAGEKKLKHFGICETPSKIKRK